MDKQMQKYLKRSRSFRTQASIRRFLKRATYLRLNRRRGDLIGRDGNAGDLTDEEKA